MDWIDLSQCTNTWQALVNAVMKLRCPQNSANLLNTFLLKDSVSWTEWVSEWMCCVVLCCVVSPTVCFV